MRGFNRLPEPDPGDLYFDKVVRQGLRISESSYSLKQVENFYMEKRDAEVVNAVESVIFYENWKLTRDPAILGKHTVPARAGLPWPQ